MHALPPATFNIRSWNQLYFAEKSLQFHNGVIQNDIVSYPASFSFYLIYSIK